MTSLELPSQLLVKAWMNPPEHSVPPSANVEEAFALMRQHGIRHLMVMDDQELLGVVTDRDLRRPDWSDGNVLSVREMYRLGDDLDVADVMTEKVRTVEPDTTTSEAARLMVENGFNCLPVVRDERVVGILTSSDLLAALVYAVDPDFEAAREVEMGR
jgi:acetoin utilization protein AcuB